MIPFDYSFIKDTDPVGSLLFSQVSALDEIKVFACVSDLGPH